MTIILKTIILTSNFKPIPYYNTNIRKLYTFYWIRGYLF